MNDAVAVILGLVVTTVLGGLLFAMPSYVARDLPLGVSVPLARAGSGAVVSANRRYRTLVLLAWMFSAAGAVVLGAVDPALAVPVPLGAMLVLGYAGYAVARRQIQRAKKAEGWFDGLPVRLRGEVLAPAPPRVPLGWFVAGAAVLAAAALWGAAVYPAFPGQVAVHWNAAGTADRFVEKSLPGVLGLPLLGLVFDAAVLLLALAVRRTPVVEDPERGGRLVRTVLGLLGQIAFLCSGLLALAGPLSWSGSSSARLVPAVAAGAGVLMLVAVVVRLVRLGAPARGPAGTDKGSDRPDTDRLWKAGVFYVNRDDPSVLVPKRFGVGWTFNFGSPGGLAVGLVLAAAITVTVAVNVVQALS
ncbi:DUF1648 domain-containing protein [Sinomonas sp. P47F7]|uniref:DUF1648 domain-containing protein n=1 Tax=Sinomonas sp. P47F7 TaxID=3410987 RepID=UPI003BF4DA50